MKYNKLRYRNSRSGRGIVHRLDFYGGAGWHYRARHWRPGFTIFVALRVRRPPSTWPDPVVFLQVGITSYANRVPISG
jgi:hypothetical protein